MDDQADSLEDSTDGPEPFSATPQDPAETMEYAASTKFTPAQRADHLPPNLGFLLRDPDEKVPRDPAYLRPETTIAGRYQIIGPLGKGGMGAVYLALDVQLERKVALKVPTLASEEHSEAIQRFYREARAVAQLHHPNICPLYDIGRHDRIHFLTMAYIEGQTLASALGKTPMDPREAAKVVQTLAQALEFAHVRGIIHRDLKPSNIMIGPERQLFVMDFGLVKRLEADDALRTKSGALLGTPAFMAPEQIDGALDKIGPHTDIYSVGVILYQLLTARLPFEGRAAMQLKPRGKPTPPSVHQPALERVLEAICLKAMAMKPKDRYPSMAALASAIEEFLETPSPLEEPRSPLDLASPGGPDQKGPGHIEHAADRLIAPGIQPEHPAAQDEPPTPQPDDANPDRFTTLKFEPAMSDLSGAQDATPQEGVSFADKSPVEYETEDLFIIEKIEEGGQGNVFVAQHKDLPLRRVVKRIRKQVLERSGPVRDRALLRFRFEAHLLGRFKHRNIVSLRNADLRPEDPFLELEYLEGETLETILNTTGSLGLARVLRILEQLCAALQYIHMKGIIHRDLKPSNVMILRESLDNRPDFVKLIDFGLAKSVEPGLMGLPRNPEISIDGNLMGTPMYASPEQFVSGGEEVDVRSDVYSLGVLLFQMITGKVPFESQTALGYVNLHRQAPVPSFKEVNPAIRLPAVEVVVKRCLAKNAGDRPRTADKLLGAFRWAVALDCLRPFFIGLAALATVSIVVGAVLVTRLPRSGRDRTPPGALALHRSVEGVLDVSDPARPILRIRRNVDPVPLSIELVRIDGGEAFFQGDRDVQSRSGEAVKLPPFSIGKGRTTRREYAAVMRMPPPESGVEEDPITNVSWDEANQYCKALQGLLGRPGLRVRLPREREWVYAAMRGTGKVPGRARESALADYMEADLSEWMSDPWTERILLVDEEPHGLYRVIRQGEQRKSDRPDVRSPHLGFRIVIVLGD